MIQKNSEDAGANKGWSFLGSGAGLTAGVLFLLLFLRILAVSRWNWDIAAELVESFDFEDAFAVSLGTLFERPVVTGVLLCIIMPALIFRLVIHLRARQTSLMDILLLISTLATAIMLWRSFSMWWVSAATAFITLVLLTVFYVWNKKDRPRWLLDIGKRIGVLVGAAVLLLAVVVDTPWISEENIYLKDGVIHGYVLASEPGFLKVMTVDREIVMLTDNDVIKRETV